MGILVAVRSFPGFLEVLLWVKAFTSGVLMMSSALIMNTTMNIITITTEEDLVVGTTMGVEMEDLVVGTTMGVEVVDLVVDTTN